MIEHETAGGVATAEAGDRVKGVPFAGLLHHLTQMPTEALRARTLQHLLQIDAGTPHLHQRQTGQPGDGAAVLLGHRQGSGLDAVTLHSTGL